MIHTYRDLTYTRILHLDHFSEENFSSAIAPTFLLANLVGEMLKITYMIYIYIDAQMRSMKILILIHRGLNRIGRKASSESDASPG